jgi:hypothetical protein
MGLGKYVLIFHVIPTLTYLVIFYATEPETLQKRNSGVGGLGGPCNHR